MSSKRQRQKRRQLRSTTTYFGITIYQPPTYPRDRGLHPGEIRRTEHRQLDPVDHNSFCRYCKNQDTQRIVDFVALEPFDKYYSGCSYRVFSCHCCGALWSHELVKEAAVSAA